MFDRLQSVEDRYDKLNELLSDPDVVNDLNKLRQYSKEQSDLQNTVDAYREYKEVKSQYKDAKIMLDDKLDADMREMVKEEVNDLEAQIVELEVRLKVLLIPKILMMTRTLSWRFGEQLEETKQLYLQVICSVCTVAMQKRKTGKLISWIPLLQDLGASKKSFS